jgi:prevent-host-death family protein
MKVVNIAELKNRLSFYLQQVRAGQEFVVRDRNVPVAKLVPLGSADAAAEELALAAEGKLRLPAQQLDEEAFWSVGAHPAAAEALEAAQRAVSEDREDRDGGLLGR